MREGKKLEFESIRWMEITSYLKKASKNGTEPVHGIEFKGKRLDMTSLYNWRKKILGG